MPREQSASSSREDSVGERSDSFMVRINLHHQNLRQYCHALTGSPWEGEDLVQDTLLKVWSAFHRGLKEEQVTLAYLYRVARNAWIDQCRKKSPALTQQPLEEARHPAADPLDVWIAMETLVQQLPPGQRTAFLLVDVLHYTASEAAAMVKTSEGAIKAALHRARVKLRIRNVALRQQEEKEWPTTGAGSENGSYSSAEADSSRTYAYLEAFRQQNTAAMVMLMNDGVQGEAVAPLLYAQSRKQSVNRHKASTNSQSVQSMYLMGTAA